jgi:aconitate hydratase
MEKRTLKCLNDKLLKIQIYFLDRSEEKINVVEQYLKATNQFRNYDDASQDPIYTKVVTLDLSTVVSSLSGPKR